MLLFSSIMLTYGEAVDSNKKLTTDPFKVIERQDSPTCVTGSKYIILPSEWEKIDHNSN